MKRNQRREQRYGGEVLQVERLRGRCDGSVRESPAVAACGESALALGEEGCQDGYPANRRDHGCFDVCPS